MSLTLNMVGGGSGGLSATDALLRVQAPAGSTVTIAKGAVTKSDFGHENALNPTYYDYYFIIHQSQFDSVNAWTVTASLTGKYPVVNTIIIDSSDEYDIVIDAYRLYLYKDGDENVSVTGGLQGYPYRNNGSGSTVVNPTVTKGTSTITVYITGTGSYNAGSIFAENSIDLTNYSKLCATITSSSGGNGGFGVYVATAKENNYQYAANANYNSGYTGTKEVDISGITGSYYLCLNEAGSKTMTFTFSEWWIE